MQLTQIAAAAASIFAVTSAAPVLEAREAQNTTKVGPYEVLYYDKAVMDCGGTNRTSLVIDKLNHCYPMTHTARSFNIGGNVSSTQIPYKYILQGFPGKVCKHGNEDSVKFNVAEGSDPGTCYVEFVGYNKPVGSLWLVDYSG